MPSTAACDRVDGATTVDEVVAAVHDFMQGLAPKEMDRLPRFNRPVMIESAEAVDRWADQLSRYEPAASQDPVNTELFNQVRDCFVRASARIAHVSGGTKRPG